MTQHLSMQFRDSDDTGKIFNANISPADRRMISRIDTLSSCGDIRIRVSPCPMLQALHPIVVHRRACQAILMTTTISPTVHTCTIHYCQHPLMDQIAIPGQVSTMMHTQHGHLRRHTPHLPR
ncbi:hypothetical protein CUC08_Gglean011426 [Alternaria sp. MG1]|nr:hypothetical protein CUC08_Gglean011426 [Alternaria sp. MG1]